MKRIASFFVSICVSMSLALACLCSAFGCTGPRRYSRTFLGAFDTATTVTAYCKNQASFDALFAEVEENMLRYHRYFDIYSEYSGMNNLKTVNANAGCGAVNVDSEIIELLEFGMEMYRLSDGRMNIMFGAVLSIWHEYRERGIASPESAALPDPAVLCEASAHCDIESLVIDKSAGTVGITDPDASLDVGAIAKGFAVEKVCKRLRELGCDSVLINAGGNIGTIGTKPGGESWLTAVQNPLAFDENSSKYDKNTADGAAAPNAADDIAYRRITDGALATSGDYQRYYEVDGERCHHIIDPATLFPAEYAVSVTVFSESAALSDAMSTALFLMPPEEAVAFAEAFGCGGGTDTGGTETGTGIEVFIVTSDGNTLSCGDWLTSAD